MIFWYNLYVTNRQIIEYLRHFPDDNHVVLVLDGEVFSLAGIKLGVPVEDVILLEGGEQIGKMKDSEVWL